MAEIRKLPGYRLIPEGLLRSAGQAAAAAAFASPQSRASLVMQRQAPVSFTVHEGGLVFRQSSSQLTVGQALADQRISLGPNDSVNPPLDSRLTPGLHVYISYAKSVRLIVEGKEQLIHTHAATVADLLAEVGIHVEASDHIYPNVDQPVLRGMSVSVTTVRETTEFTDDPISFQTIYRYDSNVTKGERLLIQPGSAGYVRREDKVKRINGQEVARDLASETTVPSTEQVVAIGTRNPYNPPAADGALAAAVSASEGLNCVRSLNVYATWYTAASAGGNGVTATGTGVYKGIVAVDPSVIPLGTRMYVPGYGYAVAADTGGGIQGYTIDLGYGPDDAKDWRTRWVDICILG